MDESVTVTAVHEVAFGREDDFYAWAASWLRQAEGSADFLGGGILGPSVAGGDWHVIYRWVDHASAQWWEDAAIRAGWMDGVESFARPVQVQQITGLRAWFEKRLQATSPPPKWKLALVTLAAVFPPVLLFNVTLIPRLLGLSVVIRTLALCIGVTVVVTWVMMPKLTLLLKDWLHPPPAHQSPETRVRAPMMATNRPGRDSNRRVLTPASTGRHAASAEDPLRPAAQTQPQRTADDQQRRITPNQPWPAVPPQPASPTQLRPVAQTQPPAAQTQLRPVTRAHPPAAQTQLRPVTRTQPRQSAQDRSWPIPEAPPQRTAPGQPWRPHRPPEYQPQHHPEPDHPRKSTYQPEHQPRYEPESEPTYRFQPKYEPEFQAAYDYEADHGSDPRPGYEPEDQSEDEPEDQPTHEPEHEPEDEFEPEDEPEPRVPRSPARTGRPVLNLVRDGQSGPPRSRRPPHRDDRSAYLRREIG